MISKYINALRDDLKRPAGGWTAGIVTILLSMLFSLVGLFTMQTISYVLAAVFMFAHLAWGAHGYYPRTMTGK